MTETLEQITERATREAEVKITYEPPAPSFSNALTDSHLLALAKEAEKTGYIAGVIAEATRDRWIPIASGVMPPKGIVVLVWDPRDSEHHEPHPCMDVLDPDSDGDSWVEHSNAYEHYSTACLEIPCIGPPETAPYSHWTFLPTSPTS